jgi:folate-binding protein YgfZ
MTFPSPIQEILEKYELTIGKKHEESNREGAATGKYQSEVLTEFLPWGDDGCFVLATAGVVELEYAAIQKSIGVFDAPCRGTIEISGEDRLDCISRLTTQKVDEMKNGEALLAFVTSRKGTVVADVIVRITEDSVLLDVDVSIVAQLVDHLNSYIVMEKVDIVNVTSTVHWIWCLGPKVCNVSIEGFQPQPLPTALLGIEGVAFMVSPDQVTKVWEAIVESGGMPIGWYALNMARVEQGSPLFMVDFDNHNLPHETSLVSSRVRFDKGCYLGQEIVARMESLGKPKKKIMRLKMETDDLPIAGSQLWGEESATGTPIGVITSSAISPLGGSLPAVIAMVSKKNNTLGTEVYMYVGSEIVRAKVIAL